MRLRALSLALTFLAIVSSEAQAAGFLSSCRDLFGFFNRKEAQSETTGRVAALEQTYRDLLREFPEAGEFYSRAEIEGGIRRFHEGTRAGKSRLVTSDVGGSDLLRRIEPYIEFERLILQARQESRLSPELTSSATTWIKSREHADYFYTHLEEFGENSNALLERLLAQSSHFSGAKTSPWAKGSLMTFSYEKESFHAGLTDFYRTPEYTDELWFALDPKIRGEKLRKHLRGNFFLKGKAVPTSRKPPELGSISEEVPMRNYLSGWYNLGTPPLEVKHGNYEIFLDSILNQVDRLASQLGERDAFHVHLVFDLPTDYAQTPQFMRWFKKVNDYLYLSGLEEGLHATLLTEMVKLDKMPTRISDIDVRSTKRFSAGLRAQIYGPSKQPGFVKIGVELRDASRKPEKLKRLAHKIADSIEMKFWEEARPFAQADPELNEFDPALISEAMDRLVASGLSASDAKFFLETEPKLVIPFTPFETRSYLSSSGSSFGPPSPEVAERLTSARSRYASDLSGIVREYKAFQARNERIEKEELLLAIQMSMSDWAKAARASELFEGI